MVKKIDVKLVIELLGRGVPGGETGCIWGMVFQSVRRVHEAVEKKVNLLRFCSQT